jgi:hypothetical protein
MNSGAFTLLRPVEPAEKCYLFEFLMWRAFGRFPEMAWDDDSKDWRIPVEAEGKVGLPATLNVGNSTKSWLEEQEAATIEIDFANSSGEFPSSPSVCAHRVEDLDLAEGPWRSVLLRGRRPMPTPRVACPNIPAARRRRPCWYCIA